MGRSLTYWLDESSAPTMERQHAARQAIQQMGTNALPGLLQHLKHKPGAWTSVTSKFSKLQESPRGYRFIPRWLSIDRPAVRADSAMYALGELAQTGVTAYPDLAALACDAAQPEAAERAIRVLAWTGSTATNALAFVLSNAPQQIRLHTLSFIIMKRDLRLLRPLQPTFIRSLHDADEEVAKRAANALLELKHAEPQAILAIYVEELHTTTPAVRAELITLIATFDTGAAPAAPSVAPLLLDADPLVRKEATNCLRRIAPEALKNASPH
jgi:hypothetical protein